MKFAELKGTEKQIKWADDIRRKLLKDLEERKDNMRPKFYANKTERLEKMLEEETDAKFYIEDANGRGLKIVLEKFEEKQGMVK